MEEWIGTLKILGMISFPLAIGGAVVKVQKASKVSQIARCCPMESWSKPRQSELRPCRKRQSHQLAIRRKVAGRGHCHDDAGYRKHRLIQSSGQLRKQKTDDMAPWRKGAYLLANPVFTGKFFRQMRRYKFAKLMQCAGIVLGRRGCFHSSDSLVGIPHRPTLFFASNNPQLYPMG